jgi:hypothetical protein
LDIISGGTPKLVAFTSVFFDISILGGAGGDLALKIYGKIIPKF